MSRQSSCMRAHRFFGIALLLHGACSTVPDDICGDLIEDTVLGRCICPPDTTPSEDGWSCLLSDGGVIVDPNAPDGSVPRFDAGPADTGPSDTGPSDTGPSDTGPSDTGPTDAPPACPEGSSCEVEGITGTCRDGRCVPASCGDGIVSAGEDCDDERDGDDLDGCRDDCRWTCEDDAACDDGNLCNGRERCDLATHTCQSGAALVCDDGDNCTADSCEPATGCLNALIDADGDGFAPASLGTCSTRPGSSRDCDDDDESRYPGAPELCNARDDDCDSSVDESGTDLECFRDADGDGYPNPAIRVLGCSCPTGYIVARSDGRTDCADTVPEANPGQTEYRTVGYMRGASVSFDWNCDGMETDLLGNQVGAPTCATTSPGSGVCRPYDPAWVALPPCAGGGTIAICRGGTVRCDPATMTYTRTCR